MSAFAAPSRRSHLRSTTLILGLAAALGVSGCVSSGTLATHAPTDRNYSAGSSEAVKAADYWGKRYGSDPKDRDTILGYAAALRRNNQLEQAMQVLRRGLIAHQSDREIAAAYGKILALNGRLKEALNVIQQAQTPARPDWKLMSAEAAIHDQLGDRTRARKLYREALKIVPGEPTVLNNLAMSHVLEGDLTTAEELLRRAAASGRADSRVRQNLALVLGLQGRFDEAEQVASNELDPNQIEANMAYLKRMLATRNAWKDIQDKQG